MAGNFFLFISYSCHDKEHQVLLRIRDRFKELTASIGGEVFMAEDRLNPGRDFIEKVTDALKAADAVLVFLTENSDASPWVNQEIGFARALTKPVYPVFDPRLKSLKGMIQTIDGCPLDEPKKIEELVKELAEAARIKHQQPTAQPSHPLSIKPVKSQWIITRPGKSDLHVTIDINYRGDSSDVVNRVIARMYGSDFEPQDRSNFPKLDPVDFKVLTFVFRVERFHDYPYDIPFEIHTGLGKSAKCTVKAWPGKVMESFQQL